MAATKARSGCSLLARRGDGTENSRIAHNQSERFITSVTKPARPSTPEAETKPHQYDGPPRTAEQVAA